MIHRGIIVYEAKKNKKYGVIRGTIPSVETWSKDEETFIMSYYHEGNEKRITRVRIRQLELLEEQ